LLVSRHWLCDFVDIPSTLDSRTLAERFTVTAAEVESVERVSGVPPEVRLPDGTVLEAALAEDWIIEIDNKSITHRPDLWGHYGIAREIAAMLSLPLKPLSVVAAAELSSGELPAIPITIDDPEKCPRYSGLRMRGVEPRTSPIWMQLRLARVGIRPINFLVDLTNYIMAELGQPMHAFDAATIDRIEVAAAATGEKFRTLDGIDRVMPPGTLMIQRGRKSVAIAGIMGGAATEVTGSTREILLESANFNAATIRRAAAAMGLRTEASARFEKSLDPNLTVQAIARFVHLARRELPGLELTSRLSDAYPAPLVVPNIELDLAHVARTIGQPVEAARIRRILEPLEFVVKERGAREGEAPAEPGSPGGSPSRLTITPPTFRATKDISIEADVIEELSRFVGYDRIEPVLPRVVARPHEAALDALIERQTLDVLAVGGPFIEVQSYVWFEDEWLTRIGHEPGPCITLKNPIAAGSSRLRRTLLAGLLAACDRNRHHMPAFQLLEIGTTFFPAEQSREGPEADTQRRMLGLAVVRSGRGAEAEVWKLLKQSLETWALQVAKQQLTYAPAEPQAPWEDPIRLCTLQSFGREVGRASMVPLDLRLKLDERLRTLNIGLAELDLSAVTPDLLRASRLTPPPAFPEAELDFSFVCDARRRYAQLADDIKIFKHALLRRIQFVDSYEGGSIKEGARSFTLRAVLGMPDRALQDSEVADFRSGFTAFLTQLGLELRV